MLTCNVHFFCFSGPCVHRWVVSDTATPWTVAHQAPVLGILQARILEWVAVSFSRGSSQCRDQTWFSSIGRRILYHWATREAWQSVTECKFLCLIHCEAKAEMLEFGEGKGLLQGCAKIGDSWSKKKKPQKTQNQNSPKCFKKSFLKARWGRYIPG